MATDDKEGGTLVSAYEDRIGAANTGDEAYGYWVFAVGVVLGVAGIALFLTSESATMMRETSIVLSAAGIALLVAGPVIRLPLQRTATYTTYTGLAMCAIAVVWFTVVFPVDWSTTTGNQPVAILYALGIAIIGVGGVFVPLVSPTETRTGAAAAQASGRASELEAELESVSRERDELADERDELTRQVEEGAAASEQASADAETAKAALRDELESVRQERDDLARKVEEGVAASEQASADAEAKQTELEGEVTALSDELDALRTSRAQFELYPDRKGEFRWRLRHRNGNIIATGGEGYTRKHNAQKGLQSVRRNALGATVVHATPAAAADEEPAETGEDALDDMPLLPAETEREESDATFELYEDRGGEWRWRLRHENGQVIADSGEGYSTRSGLTRALKGVRRNVGPADYLRFDPVSFEVFQDRGGKWRWRLVHRNGNIIGDSGQGYTRRRNAKRAIDAVRSGLEGGSLEFERYEDTAGEHRWRLRSGNGELVADSGEGYASADGLEEAIERVERQVPDADALDVGRAIFEVYEDRGGKWRWRLRHRNGNIIADCGQGYGSRHGVHDAIESVKRNAPTASEEEEDDDEE
ncbi:DUF1508 domain-containing protein [Haloarchaeobius litoreus]|uniref:DUF1508 domain-containing protein n=1 Tax=Haloarchaeobius litoreus TaxID=755306 RepID=A0ABD6DF99_9EURY|nr:DUF1508 domain-containing protein [Haloarchaeobius litoreus]